MGKNWTASQTAAITVRDKLLLVSAAAGSGKTSVLTERIIRSLTDPEHPADLGRMLVVTFTRAAAAELKNRISVALTEALAEHPGDPHLSRQLFLLGSAQISTIDSFFQQAVRANFEQLGLPSSFRLADESEITELSLEILNDTVSEFYSRYESDSQSTAPFARLQGNSFADSMNHLLSNRKDNDLDKKLLKFFHSFASYPEGIGLIDQNAKLLLKEADGDFFASSPGTVIRNYLSDGFDYYIRELQKYSDYLQTDDNSASYFSGIISSELDFCMAMREALQSGSYTECQRVIFTYQCENFPRMKNKPPIMESYKSLRDDLKTSVLNFQKDYFGFTPEEIQQQMRSTAEFCKMLYLLLSEFQSHVWEEKKSRGILEFDDVREQLYHLLTLPDGSPSPYAKSLSEQYDAVYIDEYQDVDSLQDRIFSIIGGNHRFMVGDIKQSIYGFRGSDPSIFSGYRNAMPLHTDRKAESSPAVCIFMSDNFRCDRPVIDYANCICSFLFSACENSVGYRPEDDLKCSKYSGGSEPVQTAVRTLVFESASHRKKGEKDKEEQPPRNREALWVANEIARLLREEKLDNGSPILPSDISILVRNAGHGTDVTRELKALGIPVANAGAEDLLHTPLMTDLVNLLKAIDNPHRDVPLSEYLLSPDGGFDLEELTVIRQAAPDSKSLYDAMTVTAKEPEFPYYQKVSAWVDWLEGYRKAASGLPADRLLRLLYLDPVLQVHAAEPEYLMLYEQARVYQRTSWCGLYGFLKHFEQLTNGKKLSAGGFQKAENAVQIMTIHHSKGLEFPVVFLCGCGKRFSNESTKAKLMYQPGVGCAVKLYNPETMENENTILREAAQIQIKASENEENIRALYVALTRARERLYVTGTAEGRIETAKATASLLKRGSRYSILNVSSYLRWILGAMTDSGCLSRVELIPIDAPIHPTASAEEPAPVSKSTDPSLTEIHSRFAGILNRAETFAYGLDALQGIPTKIAASKIKPDLLDTLEEDQDELSMELQIQLMQAATPPFRSLLDSKKKPRATEIGTAAHAFMEFCSYENLLKDGVQSEIDRMVSGQFLSEDSASILPKEELERFVQSDLMRLICDAKTVYREQKFSLLLPLASLTETDGKDYENQTVFVQGSIDLILEMKTGELILVDYKTDRLNESEKADEQLLAKRLALRHGNQLSCYAKAVRNLFGKAPDQTLIYSLPLGKTVRMEANPDRF